MVKVLFVCLGNICRSPTAEGVFTKLVRDRGLEGRIEIDSAGTGAWHVGESPDKRAQAEARKRGIDISGLRARAVHPSDFTTFDYIVAMDQDNYDDLRAKCPEDQQHRLHRHLAFAEGVRERSVPDPYYGGVDGFRHVYDLVEAGAEGLLKRIEEEHLS
jgi:protein-tyrosine phosphatase